MDQPVFIGRRTELGRLDAFLDLALAGQGQVVFVTGEAGAGKTALISEFTRRAQREHADLVMAIGDCNAQTGFGDPYLPFREILGLLTGDVDAKLAEGAISTENADRLRDFVRVSGEALLDLGPELIGVFVPGIGLAAKAASFAAGKVGWLDRLEKLTSRDASANNGSTEASTVASTAASQIGAAGPEQGHIFEQFTNVMRALAAQRPLILVVDDLQWADQASLNLLFHLGRRITDGRVLVIGAYRPAEVALGRQGPDGRAERHPLERVINELKRYYGDIELALESSRQAQDPDEVYEFVSDYIDRVFAPHRLDREFKQLVVERTEGHPLFLVELLHDMVERGWLAQDDSGMWYQAQTLEFDDLPARVEAVIHERIDRLENQLREILTTASIEGEDFTAQVVAQVQQVGERELLPRLSRELDKQHQLIGERGIERLNGQRLFLYRFRHTLFQRHLYNDLSSVERTILHEEVGLCLEELYAGRLEEIAVQLARHFTEAYRYDRAFRYLVMAGSAAQAAYANHEAIAHYMRALTLEDEADTEPDEVAYVHERLGKVYALTGQYALAVDHYRAALEGTQGAASRAAILRKQGRAFEQWGKYDEAVAAFEAGLAEMRGQLDAAEAARIYTGLGLVYYRRGELDNALDLAMLAQQLAGSLDDVQSVAQASNNLGVVHISRGEFASAQEALERSRTIWEQAENNYGLAAVHNNLGLLYHKQEVWQRALEHYKTSLALGERIGNRHGLARTYDNLGQVYMALGEREEAMACLEQAVAVLADIGLDGKEIYPEMWQSGAW